MKKVYKKKKTNLEYFVVEEGTRGSKLGLRKEIRAVSLRGENPVQ